MDFTTNKAIYLQIVDYVGGKVLCKEWKTEKKIPSVRELSATLEVNPNTVARAYEFLENKGIIYSKRGIGFMVSVGAVEMVMVQRKEEFLSIELPEFIKKMQMIKVTWEDVIKTEV